MEERREGEEEEMSKISDTMVLVSRSTCEEAIYGDLLQDFVIFKDSRTSGGIVSELQSKWLPADAGRVSPWRFDMLFKESGESTLISSLQAKSLHELLVKLQLGGWFV